MLQFSPTHFAACYLYEEDRDAVYFDALTGKTDVYKRQIACYGFGMPLLYVLERYGGKLFRDCSAKRSNKS